MVDIQAQSFSLLFHSCFWEWLNCENTPFSLFDKIPAYGMYTSQGIFFFFQDKED